MNKYRITTDCFCEGYLHEKSNYPREGLIEKKLYKGDIVLFVKEWGNFYGSYIRVEKDGVEYDLFENCLKKIKNIYLTIGVSGSGKSRFVNRTFIPKSDYFIISPDNIRKELTGNVSDKSKDVEVYEDVNNRCLSYLKRDKDIVIDSTNLQKERRRDFLKFISENNDVLFTYILFEPDIELSKKRIKQDLEIGIDRANVSDETLERHYKLYNEMLEDIKEEPINEIRYVKQKRKIDSYF